MKFEIGILVLLKFQFHKTYKQFDGFQNFQGISIKKKIIKYNNKLQKNVINHTFVNKEPCKVNLVHIFKFKHTIWIAKGIIEVNDTIPYYCSYRY